MLTNPILVHTLCGDLVENTYRGSYVVVNAQGDLIAAAGHFRKIIYAHSALKPIQILALVERDLEHTLITDAEIALACASHSGEKIHEDLIIQWLERLNLSTGHLECGVHYPLNKQRAKKMMEAGEEPNAAHNTCSGKHTALLTLAGLLKMPLAHYTDPHHPLQEILNTLISEMTGMDVSQAPSGIDGCQMPVRGMELKGLALAMAKLVDPKNLSLNRQKACQRIIHSMQKYPILVAGTHRFCTDVIEKTNGEVLVKMGSEGVFSVAIPKRKVGIALKIDDGNLKAAQVALLSLLSKLQMLPQQDAFTNYLPLPLHNWKGNRVGVMQPTL